MSDTPGAIFLSYASQDADAAQRICDALRGSGLEVWFDQSELRGGDAWDASIRKQIRECALFVPVISANTESRSEGYFRLEWRIAVERSHLMADDQAFLVPVVIDATPEATARVPDRFRERQWTHLPGGETSPAFVAQLGRLLSRAAAPSQARTATVPKTGFPGKRAGLLALAALAIAGAVGIVFWNARPPPAVPLAVPAVAPTPVNDRKSIAVLPFQNLSGRAEDAYLADGLQEEILNALARIRDLKVISRTSVMEYRGKQHNVREIGQRLGVGSVLEGSIRRDGNTLRLTVQLIDVRDDRHLFAANYDRDLTKVLDLQSTVARLVAEALTATLTKAERGELDRVATNSGDAYDRYLRAVALFRRPTPKDEEGVIEPKKLLTEAVRLDPNYADALALLSRVNTWTFFRGGRREDGVEARQAYERALAIDPQLPEALLARGLYSMYVAKDLGQALLELEAVVNMRPSAAEAHSFLGYALRRKGRVDEALEHFARAWDLDPLNAATNRGTLATLVGLRRYPEAIEQTRIHSRRFPNDPEPHFVRAQIESFLQGNVEPLRAAVRDHANLFDAEFRGAVDAEIARGEGRYQDAVKLWGTVPPKDPLARGERIGFLHLAAGDASKAERAFREAERYALKLGERNPAEVDLKQLALVQSMLGKHAAALATIETARRKDPEERSAVEGAQVSYVRSIILVRAGRSDEGYAEVDRLLRVPFAARMDLLDLYDPVLLYLKDDPHYDALTKKPPRL
jgi:TolB-like protein/regulator of sirC expression with transglutaminase-like and TPR domain